MNQETLSNLSPSQIKSLITSNITHFNNPALKKIDTFLSEYIANVQSRLDLGVDSDSEQGHKLQKIIAMFKGIRYGVYYLSQTVIPTLAKNPENDGIEDSSLEFLNSLDPKEIVAKAANPDNYRTTTYLSLKTLQNDVLAGLSSPDIKAQVYGATLSAIVSVIAEYGKFLENLANDTNDVLQWT